jgi:hypothetical protein
VTLEQDFAKIREIANRIGVAGRAAPPTGETRRHGRCAGHSRGLLMVLAVL